MAAETRTPRAKWVEEGLLALAAGGPDAVRVEALAKSLGVTKGGFYGFFADRDTLLAAMLDAWEKESGEDLFARAEGAGGDTRTRMRKAAELASDARLLRIDLAVRDWARRDPAVADRLRRVDNRRMGFLRSLFAEIFDDPDEVEARCLLAFSLLVGNHFMAADHGSRSREQVYLHAVRLVTT
ncbi:TetR/AcrR family transcriptional regulator [Phytomonospora sp. NPDC050363]|uniref:TetR/AcrR family transcriptional regulator n=1 Tax=Phytomonospora sp. NPDC050363 TaxID=3155642 RepID=UPI0033FB8C9A